MYTGERTGSPPKLVSKTKLLRSFLVGSVLERDKRSALHYAVDIPHATELVAVKWLIICYVIFFDNLKMKGKLRFPNKHKL